MELFHEINKRAKGLFNSGFGTNSSNYGGRFFQKDGTPNVERNGLNYFSRISWYHTLIDMPVWKFLSILLTFFILINFLFASIYFIIGLDHLNGIYKTKSLWIQFGQAYFFSTQTFTTVGYGHISPSGFLASAVAAFEALMGLLSFAIASGLFFGRFSKPEAFIKFSNNAIIAPYKDTTALMIRLTPYKNTNFTDAEVKITLAMNVSENGINTNKFFVLDLEMNQINSLNLSWTLVHPITTESPLFGFDKNDFANTTGEIMLFFKVFDDKYSTVVTAKTSYLFDEVIYGAKFNPMFSRNKNNSKTILFLNKLNDYENVTL